MFEDHTDVAPDGVTMLGVPATAPIERRAHARHVTVLRVAKLYTPHGEELCLVRNISAGGMMAHIYSDIPTETSVTVEFKSGWIVPARVMWRRDDLAGMRFHQHVDCADLLSGAQTMPFHHKARQPRVNLEVRGRLRAGADYHAVTIHNISQGGANIASDTPFELGGRVVLMVAGLMPLNAMVCWQRDGRLGVAFDNPVPLDALARWVAVVQSRRAAAEEQDGISVMPFIATPLDEPNPMPKAEG